MARLIGVVAGLVAVTALADQVVTTEVTYTHSAQTTTDSHYRPPVLPATPANWVSPVNYAGGKAVVRLEVFKKPSTVGTKFQVCFEGTPNYACTNQSPTYTQPGVYTWETPFSNFYLPTPLIDWSKGTKAIALILKDTNNVKPAPENVGQATSAMYMPTDLRVTVTLVTAGSTYIPPPPTMDAGVKMDSGVADAGVKTDAGVKSDAGVDAGQSAGGGSGAGGGSAGGGSAGGGTSSAGGGAAGGGSATAGGGSGEPLGGGSASGGGSAGGASAAGGGSGSTSAGGGSSSTEEPTGGCSTVALPGVALMGVLALIRRRRRS